jgi:hypothetical protein
MNTQRYATLVLAGLLTFGWRGVVYVRAEYCRLASHRILKAAHARGWSVLTQPEHPFLTQVSVLEKVIAISITEKTRQV